MTFEKMNVLFRVDGGREVGMGHLVRCLALARELVKSGAVEPLFLMKNYQHGVSKVAQQEFPVRQVMPTIDVGHEVTATVQAMQELQTGALITDILNVNPEYLRGIKEARGSSLIVSIDDLGTLQGFADIVINGSIVDERLHYDQSQARHYLGTDYCILQTEFLEVHQRERVIRESARSVLVTMGGSDSKKLTVKVLKALEELERDIQITAIVGPAFAHRDEIKNLAQSSKKKVHLRYDGDSMAEAMILADIAFCAGGDTLYELAAAGTPCLVMAFSDLERITAEAMQKKGATISLGLGEYASGEQIRFSLEGLLDDLPRRRQMSQRGKKLVDARGLERVSKLILSQVFKKEVSWQIFKSVF